MTITFPYRTEAGPTAHSTITLTYDFDLSTRSRIDLLLAPGEVVAVSLESIVSAEGDPLLGAGQPDRETARAALEEGWIATC